MIENFHKSYGTVQAVKGISIRVAQGEISGPRTGAVKGIQALANHSITNWYPAVLIVVGLICGLAGLVIFNRRDLPTT